MDKETPRSHTGQSAHRSEPESSKVDLAEAASDPGLQHSFEHPDPTRDRTRPGLYTPEEADPRTVPRSMPRSNGLRSLRPVEERPQPNYEVRPGPTPRPSSSGTYRVANPRTNSTMLSSPVGPCGTAQEVGPSSVSQDSDSFHSEVSSEDSRSNVKYASESTSTATSTNSRPSRGEELRSCGTANNGAAGDSSPSVAKVGPPQLGLHEEILSYSYPSSQHASCANEYKVPVVRDVISQHCTETDGQTGPRTQESTSEPPRAVRDDAERLQGNLDTSSPRNIRVVPSNDANPFRNASDSPSDCGSSGQNEHSRYVHFLTDEDPKLKAVRVMPLPKSVGSTTTPLHVPMLSTRSRCEHDLVESISLRTPDQLDAENDYSQPPSMPAAPPDTQQIPSRSMPPSEGNGRERSGSLSGVAGNWTPGYSDYSVKAGPGQIRESRNSTLSLSRLELVEAPRTVVEPRTIPADPKLFPSIPLHAGNGHDDKDVSASSSPISTSGLDVTDVQDGLSCTSSTFSTDPSEYSEPEDIRSKHGPSSRIIGQDGLTEERVTCLDSGYLHRHIVLNLPNLVKDLRKCPGGSSSGQTSTSAGKSLLTGRPYRRDNNGLTRPERDNDHGDEGDDQSRRPEQKSQKLDDSPTKNRRPLACPFYKYDPRRYSAVNEVEKEYRGCSSGYWLDISRLKQHLYRTHLRPEFYCHRCYLTFEEYGDFDSHFRQQAPCDLQTERQFQEKINHQQHIQLKKKSPRTSPRNSWDAIFKILFPHADVPESPYFEIPEHEVRRSPADDLGREIAPILSSPLQENFHPPLIVDPDLSDRICGTATTLAPQCVTSGNENTSCQAHAHMHSSRGYTADAPSSSQFCTDTFQAHREMSGPMFHGQQYYPGQDFPVSFELGGDIPPCPYYNNMVLSGQDILGGYQVPLSQQPEAGVTGAAFDMAFADPYGIVDQNVSMENDSTPTYNSVTGHSYH